MKASDYLIMFIGWVFFGIFLLLVFTMTGFLQITIEKSFQPEYKTCLAEKQVVSDKLSYCQDVKGLKNNGPDGVFMFTTILAYVIGIGIIIFNLHKKNGLDTRITACDAREKKLDEREIHLKYREHKVETEEFVINNHVHRRKKK